ncbi:hypothetical protein Tco_1037323 [Tanacetum coccineum]
MEKVYSLLQAEVTASEGRTITFMDSNTGDKAQKGRPWEGFEKKNRERQDRELKNYIEEAIKLKKLAYLIKGNRKGRAKQADNPLGEWAAPTMKMKPVIDGKEESILMIVLRKEVWESRKDTYTTLLGFSGEQVNSLGEISLQITLGMIPSTMHFAVLYPSEIGPKFIMSEYQDIRRCEQIKRLKESFPEAPLMVSECVNLEEKVIVYQKYPEQTMTIGRQLTTQFKQELVKLLRDNADIFA